MGKLIVLESGLLKFLGNDDLVIVNPYCKKQKQDSAKENTFKFEQEANSQTQVISFKSICNPQIKIDFFIWEPQVPELITTNESLFLSRLTYLYLDNHSPPPKIA